MEGRIIEIERTQTRQAAAEAAPGGVPIEGSGPGEFGDWVRVTFAEKPEHEVLEALRAAGFRWGGGSWSGERSNIPACVLALTNTEGTADAPPADLCACHAGDSCDVAHDPATCACQQCRTAESSSVAAAVAV
jgi:hypothetical protein